METFIGLIVLFFAMIYVVLYVAIGMIIVMIYVFWPFILLAMFIGLLIKNS